MVLGIQQNQSIENTSEDTTFCNLQEDLVINMTSKLINTATKAAIDAAKTASKQVVQKTAEATEDMTGNKIADKIITLGHSKSKHCKKNYIS